MENFEFLWDHCYYSTGLPISQKFKQKSQEAGTTMLHLKKHKQKILK